MDVDVWGGAKYSIQRVCFDPGGGGGGSTRLYQVPTIVSSLRMLVPAMERSLTVLG